MIRIFNTLKRQKEDFNPIHAPFVGMYVCGPTVYEDPHLGHAKSYVSFDVMVRHLRASGFHVRYVQNITDVGHLLGDDTGEDRILKRAKLEKLEPVEIAQKYERHFFRDMDRLNCLRPDISSRASGHIPEMIELVKNLLEKGFAYETSGNVYFEVSRFSGYGKLSGKKTEELKEGTRIQGAEDKRNPNDFALWKKADPEHLMQWPSPWGMGYPGWHLECSVMAMKYLGESIDIHGGGLDNQFPHHECEIAQSEAATGKPFVKYWVHNNMVTADKQKMSKSLGNFVTLNALFQKYHPMVVRFFILEGHYRSPQDFSEKALEAARSGYERMSRTMLDLRKRGYEKDADKVKIIGRWKEYQDRFQEMMDDDFNTAGALAVLFDLVKETNTLLASSSGGEECAVVAALFHRFMEESLGLTFSQEDGAGQEREGQLVQLILDLRDQLRAEKKFALADEIRNRMEKMGFVLEDGPQGTGVRKK